MHCSRCHSPRIIRFLDGFGERRIFCRSCHESVSLEDTIHEIVKAQKRLLDFTDYYSNLVNM